MSLKPIKPGELYPTVGKEIHYPPYHTFQKGRWDKPIPIDELRDLWLGEMTNIPIIHTNHVESAHYSKLGALIFAHANEEETRKAMLFLAKELGVARRKSLQRAKLKAYTQLIPLSVEVNSDLTIIKLVEAGSI